MFQITLSCFSDIFCVSGPPTHCGSNYEKSELWIGISFYIFQKLSASRNRKILHNCLYSSSNLSKPLFKVVSQWDLNYIISKPRFNPSSNWFRLANGTPRHDFEFNSNLWQILYEYFWLKNEMEMYKIIPFQKWIKFTSNWNG